MSSRNDRIIAISKENRIEPDMGLLADYLFEEYCSSRDSGESADALDMAKTFLINAHIGMDLTEVLEAENE